MSVCRGEVDKDLEDLRGKKGRRLEDPYLCTETLLCIRMGSHRGLVPRYRLKPTSIL